MHLKMVKIANSDIFLQLKKIQISLASLYQISTHVKNEKKIPTIIQHINNLRIITQRHKLKITDQQ